MSGLCKGHGNTDTQTDKIDRTDGNVGEKVEESTDNLKTRETHHLGVRIRQATAMISNRRSD
jgi:hypothetical protein